MQLLEEARKVLRIEIAALETTALGLDHRFEKVMALIEATHTKGGKLLFLGIGKNVFIAQKLAATFNSTGVPSLFMDPIAAMHGDMGLCVEGDLAFLFSNSGQTEELLAVLPSLKRLGAQTVAITKELTSTLAQNCDFTLPYAVPTEACPLNLAPTSSTTAALALGDALAMVYLKKRGFKPEDFAKYHPSGTLGKTLLLRVSDVMRPLTQMALAHLDTKVIDALGEMTQKKCGLVSVVDESGKMAGVFSDGDFRRLALKSTNPLQELVATHMCRTPKTIQAGMMAVDALKRFEAHKIDDLVVVDEYGFPVGLVDSQDFPKLKIV